MEITATPSGVVPTVIGGNVKDPSAFKTKGIKPRKRMIQSLLFIRFFPNYSHINIFFQRNQTRHKYPQQEFMREGMFFEISRTSQISS